MRAIFFVILVLAVSACTYQDDFTDIMNVTPGVSEHAVSGIEVWYADDALHYVLIIEKASPCHTVEVEELVLESYPVQVVVQTGVQAPAQDVICAQVITPEHVQGDISINHVPQSVRIDVNGETVYTNSTIEQR